MGNIGITEFVLMLLMILLFFGSRKIPGLARGLGNAIRELRLAARGVRDGAGDGAKYPGEEMRGAERKG